MTGPTSPTVRAGIIRHIRDYVLSKTAGVFAGIDPLMFGTQLAPRVRRPRGVEQGQTGLCGPASFMYSFAKGQPRLFAKYGLDLFFQGQGFLGTMEVQPSLAVLENYHLRMTKIPWAVDYVTLVSLRQCTFFADTRGLASSAERTKPRFQASLRSGSNKRDIPMSKTIRSSARTSRCWSRPPPRGSINRCTWAYHPPKLP